MIPLGIDLSSPTVVFVLGVLGLAGTIVGAVVALRKLGPEIGKLTVDTSASLVAMARENAEMHRTDAAELRQRNEALDNRLTEYVEKLGRAMADIEGLKKKAESVERLQAENARLRRERNQALSEVTSLRNEVQTLRQEVAALRTS